MSKIYIRYQKIRNTWFYIGVGIVLAIFLSISFLSVASVRASYHKNIIIDVPFTSQAPRGEWNDQRQQDGCEEASVAMAMAWAGGEENIGKDNWRLRILILSTFEKRKYGEYRDVSLRDTEIWLLQDYFKYKNTKIKKIESVLDIIEELE